MLTFREISRSTDPKTQKTTAIMEIELLPWVHPMGHEVECHVRVTEETIHEFLKRNRKAALDSSVFKKICQIHKEIGILANGYASFERVHAVSEIIRRKAVLVKKIGPANDADAEKLSVELADIERIVCLEFKAKCDAGHARVAHMRDLSAPIALDWLESLLKLARNEASAFDSSKNPWGVPTAIYWPRAMALGLVECLVEAVKTCRECETLSLNDILSRAGELANIEKL